MSDHYQQKGNGPSKPSGTTTSPADGQNQPHDTDHSDKVQAETPRCAERLTSPQPSHKRRGAVRDERPRIRIRPGDSPATLRDLIEKLHDLGPTQLYLRDTEVIYVCNPISGDDDADDADGVKLLRATPEMVMAYFERQFRFEKKGAGDKWQRCNMPRELAQRFLALPDHTGLYQLRGFAPCPTLRPDGSLLSEPGYDRQTGLYQTGNLAVSVPGTPTRQQAHDALAVLRSFLSSFPFAGKERGELLAESVAIGAIVGAILRPCLATMPGIGLTAFVRGSGKSYLANTIAMIVTGRKIPSLTVSPRLEEFEKALNAMLFEAHPIICLDNVETPLKGAQLAEAITEPDVRVRVLGLSKMLKISSTTAILATGNNLEIKGDLSRRWLICELDAGMEHPEERKFSSDPLTEAGNRRAELISAALTIARYGLSLDPRDHDGGFPGFQDWYRRVALPLTALGMPDPVKSLDLARGTDSEAEALEQLMRAWWAVFKDQPKTCREVIEYPNGDLQEALRAVASDRHGEPCSRALGYYLKRMKNRPAGGRCFVNEGKTAGGAIWRLVEHEGPAS